MMVCPTPIFKKGADGQRFFFLAANVLRVSIDAPMTLF